MLRERYEPQDLFNEVSPKRAKNSRSSVMILAFVEQRLCDRSLQDLPTLNDHAAKDATVHLAREHAVGIGGVERTALV